MQSELKPCPFCGADFKMGQEPQDNHPVAGQFYLYHNYGPLGSAARLCSLSINRHFYTEAEAIAAWNARASDAEITRLTEALRAAEEREKGLREALFNATALIGHSVPMDTTALVAGEQLTAQGVWLQGAAALKGPSHD